MAGWLDLPDESEWCPRCQRYRIACRHDPAPRDEATDAEVATAVPDDEDDTPRSLPDGGLPGALDR